MTKIPVVVTQYHSLFRFHTFELKLYNELHMSEGYKIQRKIAQIKPTQQVWFFCDSVTATTSAIQRWLSLDSASCRIYTITKEPQVFIALQSKRKSKRMVHYT